MSAQAEPVRVVRTPANRRIPWRETWLRLRNRLIASVRFQRWAARFPLTRPIARHHAKRLFDLVAGFVYSQILSACVRLDLFAVLADGPVETSQLAGRLRLTEDATTTLLNAACALDLAQKVPGGGYVLGQLGAALRGNPGVSAMIEHHALLYGDLSDPVALLRGDIVETGLSRFWAYAKSPDCAACAPSEVGPYSALMAQSQSMVAAGILDAYPFARHRNLLDIGGGEGVFLAEAGRRCPRLGLMVFDLPAVADRARARLSSAGLAERARIHAGSFFDDPLPLGADVASLVRVLHDHDDERALAILRAAHRALPAGGSLVVAEPMAGTPGAQAMGDAYFGFYLRAMGSGRPRTPGELGELLHRAGFCDTRLLPTHTPLVVSVIAATVSASKTARSVNKY